MRAVAAPSRYRLRPWQRLLVIAGSFGLAGVAAVAVQGRVPPATADIASVAAIWIALYPIPWLNPRIPWWRHWVQGAVILLGFWIATRWM